MLDMTYRAAQGDMFDMIARRYYGDEKLAVHIVNANIDYADVLIFEGGEVLTIPQITVEQAAPPPPWR